MYRTRVKVCGITRAEDAAAAVAAGVDALGVVLAPSKRQLTIDQAALALADVPPFVARIGVFVDAAPSFVEEAVRRIGLSAVQFHGGESPAACAAAPIPVIKALRVGTAFAATDVEPFRGSVAAFLLDTFVPGANGGTGKVFDWHEIADLPGWAHLIVAGGLHSGNVAEAVRVLRPYGVDVSSGVEDAPGIKSAERIHAFVAAVRAADQEVSNG